MDDQRISDRKSRIVFQRADGRAPEWRAVGSIMILAPDCDRPLFVDGVGYTVYLKESRQEGDLREAIIILRRLRRPTWVTVLWCALGTLFLGIGLTRAWFLAIRPLL